MLGQTVSHYRRVLGKLGVVSRNLVGIVSGSSFSNLFDQESGLPELGCESRFSQNARDIHLLVSCGVWEAAEGEIIPIILAHP
jgi:hypothetical protein